MSVSSSAFGAGELSVGPYLLVDSLSVVGDVVVHSGLSVSITAGAVSNLSVLGIFNVGSVLSGNSATQLASSLSVYEIIRSGGFYELTALGNVFTYSNLSATKAGNQFCEYIACHSFYSPNSP